MERLFSKKIWLSGGLDFKKTLWSLHMDYNLLFHQKLRPIVLTTAVAEEQALSDSLDAWHNNTFSLQK